METIQYVTPFYSLRTYERHEVQDYYKGNEKLSLRDNGWKRFNRSFDINYNVIIDYKEYVLFENTEDSGTRCIKVIFHDRSYIYAAYSWEAFEKWVNELYLPLYICWFKNLNKETNEEIES